MWRAGDIITMTKHPPQVDTPPAPETGAGAPEMFTVSCPDLAAAIRAELEEFFHDGVSPTLGRYGGDRIVGGIIMRVADRDRSFEDR